MLGIDFDESISGSSFVLSKNTDVEQSQSTINDTM